MALLKTGHRSGLRKSTNWLPLEANNSKKRRRRLDRRWKASKTESDRETYHSACSFTNKFILKSNAESNLECIKDDLKNPKRLWSTIKALLHSSPMEQLSPSFTTSGKFSVFFFISVKWNLLSKSHYPPNCTADFQILLQSLMLKSLNSFIQCRINHHILTLSQLLIWKSCAGSFLSSSPILQTYHSPIELFSANFKLALMSPFCKNLVRQNRILPISGPFLIFTQSAKV